jgi:hypothetical protein
VPARVLTDAEFQAAAGRLQFWPSSQNTPRVSPAGWAAAEVSAEQLPKQSGFRLALTVTGSTDVMAAVRQADSDERETLRRVAEEINASPEAEALASARSRLEKLRQGEAAVKAQLAEATAALGGAAEPADVRRLGRKQTEAQAALASFAGPLRAAARDAGARAGDLERVANATLARHRAALSAEVAAVLPSWGKPVPIPPDVPAVEWLSRLAWACTLAGRLHAPGWGQHAVRQALAQLMPAPPAVAAPTATPDRPMGLSLQDAPVI